MSISTNDVAPYAIKDDLLTLLTVNERLLQDETHLQLYARFMKQSSKTFAGLNKPTNSKVKKMTKEASVKCDCQLFQRLLVAAESGRKIDLAKVMQHELTSYAISLTNIDGELNTTVKCALGQVLYGKTNVEALSATDLETAYIIDGMA